MAFDLAAGEGMVSGNLPSVTQVIGNYIDWSKVNPDVLEAAAYRGGKVHQYIAMQLLGLWIPGGIEPHYQGYMDSFTAWHDQTVERTLYVEIEVICTCFGFIGHIDWVGIIRGDKGLSILDWKSPIAEAKSFVLQLSTYKHLAEEHIKTDLPVNRCGAVMLNAEGKPARMIEYTDVSAAAFNVFVGMLGGHKWMNR